MKHVRRITLLMALVMLFATTTAAFSASAADARLNNTFTTSEAFYITDGVATVVVAYTGYEGVTDGATAHVVIQRKTLLWWSDVITWDIGFNGWTNSIEREFELDKTGEYRAIIEYTITGSAGEADELSVTLYDEW